MTRISHVTWAPIIKKTSLSCYCWIWLQHPVSTAIMAISLSSLCVSAGRGSVYTCIPVPPTARNLLSSLPFLVLCRPRMNLPTSLVGTPRRLNNVKDAHALMSSLSYTNSHSSLYVLAGSFWLLKDVAGIHTVLFVFIN
jgi:hypothetical protein